MIEGVGNGTTEGILASSGLKEATAMDDTEANDDVE